MMDSMQQSPFPPEDRQNDNSYAEQEAPEQTPVTTNQDVQVYQIQQRFKNGANWFYWIAGLSLINSVLWLTGQEWTFIFGLGATQIVDSIVMIITEEHEIGNWVKFVAFGLDLMIAGIYVLFGFLANKGFKAGFIVGMVLYALDGLLFLLAADILSLAFHAFALYCIFGGLKAMNQLRQLTYTEPPMPDMQTPEMEPME